MKKRLLMFALCLGIALYAAPAFASLQNGSWSSTAGDFNVSQWQEILWGGGEGQAGNEIQASGYNNSNPQWWLRGAVISSVQDLGGGVYSTIYTGGNLDLYLGGPWNPGTYDANYDRVTMTSFTNTTTKYGDGSMSFDITGTGIFGDQTIAITAHYDRATPYGPFTFTGTNPNTGLSGSAPDYFGTLTSGSVTVTPIPAAVWLLGSGLFGLVAIRRKFKK